MLIRKKHRKNGEKYDSEAENENADRGESQTVYALCGAARTARRTGEEGKSSGAENRTLPEMEEELDRQMHLLAKGQMATIVYFQNGEYIKITGLVARIDETSRLLQIVNTKIRFEDILQVETEIPNL